MRTIPAELAKRYEAEGWWTRETLGDVLARGLAAGLRDRGVGPGDMIAFQLPNWMEAAAVFWASAFLGAVVVPIVHFYGRKEVAYILQTIAPSVFVTAERFGRLEYQADLSAGVPIVGLVSQGGSPPGAVSFDELLGAETRQLAERYPPDRGRQLTAAPVGHFIGMLNAFLIPLLDGSPVNLADVWDPALVLALMASDGLTVGGGAPYYLTSLLDHPDFTPGHLRHMKYAGLGGAAVPAAVTTRLAGLGITAWRSYGSTEHPSITGSPHTAPAPKRLYTDGNVLPGVEIRLAADGEIFSRGPDLCLGYTDQALTDRVFDEEGWYRTGDIGVLDEDGYLTITDRKSDIIIRGGENISALEVEDVLLAMPGIAEVAVVAGPDARLGEHAAAFVRLKAGTPVPTLGEMRAHLERAGLARPKWPEELHAVDDFPRTATGKVQKYILRRDIAARQK